MPERNRRWQKPRIAITREQAFKPKVKELFKRYEQNHGSFAHKAPLINVMLL